MEPAKARILIVDDEPLNLELLGDLLAVEGYEVVAATSGREGISLARSRHPDLVLIDIMMPDLDGLQVTRRLKADPRTRTIPIVAVTSCAMKGDETRIRQAGCDGYISKPIDIDSFLRGVERVLGIETAGTGAEVPVPDSRIRPPRR